MLNKIITRLSLPAWKMNRRNKKPKWQYGKPPVYLNFPISFFSSLDGERLDVPQFKAMVGEIISYGVADWYRRELSAWQNPREYDYKLFSRTLGKMDISVGDEMNYFYNGVLPSMERVTRSAGHAFCGIPIQWLISFLNDDVSDYECMQFLGYCAIRSILGRSLYDGFIPVPKRITWEFILSRMAGNNKRVPVDKLPPFIAAYAIRRKRDKLRKSLIHKWHVQVDGQRRGRGGAYYMIHDGEPIAKAVENLMALKKLSREERADKAQQPKDPLAPF